MEQWVLFTITISICISALLRALYGFVFPKLKLPPGPTSVPVVGNLLWLLKTTSELEPILRKLHAKYGPIVTLQMGSRSSNFISGHSLAHHALIQNGAGFDDRPKALPTIRVLSSDQHSINSAVGASSTATSPPGSSTLNGSEAILMRDCGYWTC